MTREAFLNLLRPVAMALIEDKHNHIDDECRVARAMVYGAMGILDADDPQVRRQAANLLAFSLYPAMEALKEL